MQVIGGHMTAFVTYQDSVGYFQRLCQKESDIDFLNLIDKAEAKIVAK